MSGKVGRNVSRSANDVRPFICEVYGGEDGQTITVASLFETYATATFPLSGQAIDPSFAKLCGLEIGLAGLGDETADGEVSTACDAVVTDTETGKTKNLEPGGNYAFEVPLGNSVPDVEVFVSPGSVVVVCGMFCSKIDMKTLEVFANLELPEDTFGVPRPATAGEVGAVDFFGKVIPEGANVVEYPGGKIVCQPSDSCCTYTETVETLLTEEAYQSAYAGPKNDGDTLITCHPNGFSVQTCAAGAWVTNFEKKIANDGTAVPGVTTPDDGIDAVDQSGNAIPDGTYHIAFYNPDGTYASSYCPPRATLVCLGYEKDVDANGEACPGVITYLWGSLKTGVVSRKTSQCTVQRSEVFYGGFNLRGFSPTNDQFLDDPDLLPGGTIIPWLGNTIAWTTNKVQDVDVTGYWSFAGANFRIDGTATFSIDGGAFSSQLSGGNDDDVASGTPDRRSELHMNEEFCLPDLAKGDHTIAVQMELGANGVEVADISDPRAFSIGSVQGHFKVRWLEEVCLEVEV